MVFVNSDLRQVKGYMAFGEPDLRQVNCYMAFGQNDLRQVICYMAFGKNRFAGYPHKSSLRGRSAYPPLAYVLLFNEENMSTSQGGGMHSALAEMICGDIQQIGFFQKQYNI